MIITVTYENGNVFGHFGQTKEFKIYEINNNQIISSKVVDNQGKSHKGLIEVIKYYKTDILICGGIGDGAREILENNNIKYYPGVTGSADLAVNDFILGKLNYNLDAKCNHSCHH